MQSLSENPPMGSCTNFPFSVRADGACAKGRTLLYDGKTERGCIDRQTRERGLSWMGIELAGCCDQLFRRDYLGRPRNLACKR